MKDRDIPMMQRWKDESGAIGGTVEAAQLQVNHMRKRVRLLVMVRCIVNADDSACVLGSFLFLALFPISFPCSLSPSHSLQAALSFQVQE